MNHLTGNAAATLLGVSRRTLYRWHAEGRLYAWEWTAETIEARRPLLQKRPRGPQRDPRSRRYTIGRHRFEK
jgi:hypothetical protein